MRSRYNLFLTLVLVLSIPLLGAQEPKKRSKGDKGYLGVQIQDVNSKIEKRYKLPSDEGAFISEVVEEGPAEKAGMKEDDVILSFAGKAVYDAEDLSRFVSRTPPDTKVDVVVWRDGAKKTLPVTVGVRKARSFAFRGPVGDHDFMVWAGRGSYGVELSTLTDQLGEYFGVPEKEGVLVESVKDESAASRAGLKAGDVITKVGNEKVQRSVEVLHELSDYDDGEKVELEVYRKGSRTTLTLEIEKGDDKGFNYFFEDFGGRGGAVVAPRMRMHIAPEPDVDVHIERFDDKGIDTMRRELRESLDGLDSQEIRIRKRAPLIDVRTKRITL